MNKNDLMALSFREDLIKLLKKYDCEISGSYMDDGYMSLEFNSGLGNYFIQDEIDNYNIQNDNYENIIDNYILNCFSEHNDTMSGLNNAKVHTGIFTNNKSKAENKIKEIYDRFDKNNIYRFLNSKNHKELQLIDGSSYVWIKPIDNSKGYRCTNAFIDRELSLEELKYIVFPICRCCGKDTVKVF